MISFSQIFSNHIFLTPIFVNYNSSNLVSVIEHLYSIFKVYNYIFTFPDPIGHFSIALVLVYSDKALIYSQARKSTINAS